MGAEEFRQNAKECMKLAEMAVNPESKVVLVDIAQTWIRLADQASEGSDNRRERRFCSII
jgi:hypothetical protein